MEKKIRAEKGLRSSIQYAQRRGETSSSRRLPLQKAPQSNTAKLLTPQERTLQTLFSYFLFLQLISMQTSFV